MLILRIPDSLAYVVWLRETVLRPDGCSLTHGGNGYGMEVWLAARKRVPCNSQTLRL